MSSSILGEEYQIFVPDRSEDELDPSMGVLVEEEMNPINEKYLANSTQVLINFTENEAYFPSDYRVDIEDAKDYVRDVCDKYELDAPDFYVEVDRREENPAGASWEGSWNNLLEDIWHIFTQDGNPKPLEEHAVNLGYSTEEERDMDFNSYLAATEL